MINPDFFSQTSFCPVAWHLPILYAVNFLFQKYAALEQPGSVSKGVWFQTDMHCFYWGQMWTGSMGGALPRGQWVLGTSKQDKNTYLQKCYKYQCPSIYDKDDLYRSSSEVKKSSDLNQKFTSVICLCSYVLSASIAQGRVRHRRLKADLWLSLKNLGVTYRVDY